MNANLEAWERQTPQRNFEVFVHSALPNGAGMAKEATGKPAVNATISAGGDDLACQ